MQYRIVGVRDRGTIDTLILDADGVDEARRAAIDSGLAVIRVARVGRLALGRFGSTRTAGTRPRGEFKLDLFCQELLALLSAGITVGEALETLAAKGSGTATHVVVAELLRHLREGQSLSRAMALRADIFPSLLTESLRASERTSDYVPALTRFVRYRRLASDLRSKLASASIYPLILLAVSGAVLLFLVGYVVPRFAQVYAEMGDRLPLASRILLITGQAIESYPVLFLGLLAALVILLVVAWRSGSLRLAALRVVRRLPRLSEIFTAVESARMYRTLALLVHGGIPVVTALDVARGLVGIDMALRISTCRAAIAEGRAFSVSMSEHGLSTVVADRFFRVGEQTGRLAEMIDRAAEFHEDEISRAADWMGRVVGPVLMLVMGCVIGLVVVLMYLPIFQLSDAIQ